MKRFIAIVFCACLCQPLPAVDRADTYPPADGFATLAAIDAPTPREAIDTRGSQAARGLFLDAVLLDREGRRWQLQWKLIGDRAGSPRAAERNSWRAGVVLTTPDGLAHERVFERGAGRIGSFAFATDDWEWRQRGSALLPARLRFDVDGRAVILLLETLAIPGGADAREIPRVKVRGFVSAGLEKTYLSGRGQLQRDWQRLAGRVSRYARPNHAPQPAAAR